MAAESNDIRNKTRRVKQLILDKYLKMAEIEEATGFQTQAQADMFKELTLVFAKSVVPRTQEITGEDGEAIQITLVKYAQPLEESQAKVDTGVPKGMDETVPQG